MVFPIRANYKQQPPGNLKLSKCEEGRLGAVLQRERFLCTFHNLIRLASLTCVYFLSSLRILVVLTKSSIRAHMKGGMKNKLSKEHYPAGNLLAFIARFQISSGYFERTGFVWIESIKVLQKLWWIYIPWMNLLDSFKKKVWTTQFKGIHTEFPRNAKQINQPCRTWMLGKSYTLANTPNIQLQISKADWVNQEKFPHGHCGQLANLTHIESLVESAVWCDLKLRGKYLYVFPLCNMEICPFVYL